MGFKCAACGTVFTSIGYAESCNCRVLILPRRFECKMCGVKHDDYTTALACCKEVTICDGPVGFQCAGAGACDKFYDTYEEAEQCDCLLHYACHSCDETYDTKTKAIRCCKRVLEFK